MRRNVLQLIGSFNEGGSERQALQLAHLLKRSGRHNVHLACLDASGVLRTEVDRMGFGDIPEFPLTSFYDRNGLRQLRRFARFLKERQIVLVHAHDFYTNVFGMPGAALAGVQARIASRRETTGWRTGLQKFVERRAYDLAHRVVTNAEAVRQQLVSEGVRAEKTVTIYNGLDLERVSVSPTMRRDAALATFGLPANGKFVTIVANLRHAVKNHSMFLRAAVSVSKAVPESRFVIAGEGELMPSLRAMADELGLNGKVFFIGRCERIGDLLELTEVGVLSSVAEGFSNSILEYMAAARPVVATDVGGAREAIVDGQTGYLVRSNDHEAMAKRIVSLLRDPDSRCSMGKRGRQIVERRFSCQAQLDRTEALYERLLSSSRSLARQELERSSEVSLEVQP